MCRSVVSVHDARFAGTAGGANARALLAAITWRGATAAASWRGDAVCLRAALGTSVVSW